MPPVGGPCEQVELAIVLAERRAGVAVLSSLVVSSSRCRPRRACYDRHAGRTRFARIAAISSSRRRLLPGSDSHLAFNGRRVQYCRTSRQKEDLQASTSSSCRHGLDETTATTARPTPARRSARTIAIQPVHHGPPTGGITDRGQDAGAAQRGRCCVLRQRPATERDRQPGAVQATPTRPSANVSFYPVTRAAWWRNRRWGTRPGFAGRPRMYSGMSAMANTNNFQKSQDTLSRCGRYRRQGALGQQTILSQGVCRRRTHHQLLRGWLLLGEHGHGRAVPPHQDHARGRPLKLDYRQGYYARQGVQEVHHGGQRAATDRRADAGRPITELTIAMEVNYFQLNSAEYFVPVVVKIRAASWRSRGRAARSTR